MVTEAYWFAKSPHNAELFVDISSTIDKKIQALLKHDCQMVLTLDGFMREAETLGADLPLFRDLPPDGHRAIVDMGLRQFCDATGAKAGMAYAEQFRYEKLGSLDKLLGTDLIQPDF
jgi:hypothetical protein